MVTTFFFGNGLDVGLGIKSRYTDFYDYFKLKCDKSGIEKYKDFCKDLMELKFSAVDNKDYKWSDFEQFMGEYAGKFDSESKQDFINFLDFFCSTFMEYLEPRAGKLKDEYGNLDFMFEKGLLYYDSADEKECPKFSKGFTEKIEEVRNTFWESCERINIISFNYTEVIEEQLAIPPRNGAKAEDYQISHEHTSFQRLECCGRIGYIDYLGHIHGSVRFDPIMGVNDPDQIRGGLKDDEDFKSYVVKSELMDINRNISSAVIKERIDAGNVICVYGCSLGETDKKWWHLILEKLASDCNSQLLIFVHDQSVKDAAERYDCQNEQVQNLMRCLIEGKKNEILLTLKQYALSEGSDGGIDVNALRDRIHVALNHDIFCPGYVYGLKTREPKKMWQIMDEIEAESNRA